jgi:hypothetical protein
LLAYVHEFAVEDADGGKAGGGDLDGGFDGRPDGRGNEVPCPCQLMWKGNRGQQGMKVRKRGREEIGEEWKTYR